MQLLLVMLSELSATEVFQHILALYKSHYYYYFFNPL